MARLKMHGWGQLILSIMLLLADFISPAKSGQALLDEAKRAGREAPSFPQAGEDYFHDMDNGVAADTRRDQGPQYVDCLDWWQ